MKKLTTVALAGAMVAVSSFAMASASRWTGFGAASQFVSDVQDIWTLPAVVASNPDATYLEFGNGYDAYNDEFNNTPGTQLNDSVTGGNYGKAWGGAHMSMGPGVLGIWGNRPLTNMLGKVFTVINDANGPGAFAAPNLGGPSANFYTPDHTIDLFYAWDLNDKLAVGVGLTRAQDSNNITETKNNAVDNKVDEENTFYGINLGANMKDLGAIDLLEVGLQYSAGGNINETKTLTTDNKNTADYDQIDLRVSATMNGDKGKFSRAELTLDSQSLDQKTAPNAAPPANSYVESQTGGLGYLLGWAMGMKGEQGMGLGGFTLAGSTANISDPNELGANTVNKYSEGNLALNFVTGGEMKVKDWVTTRAGLSTSLWSSYNATYEHGASANTTKTTYYWENGYNASAPTTVLSMGLSFNIGDMVIDGALNQDLLFNGPFLTNGIATQLFSQVSATWNWGGAKE